MARIVTSLALLAITISSTHANVISDALGVASNATSNALHAAANVTKSGLNQAGSFAGDVADKVSNALNADIINSGKKSSSTAGEVTGKAGSMSKDAKTKNSTVATVAPVAPVPPKSAAVTSPVSVAVVTISVVSAIGFTML